MPMRVLKRWSRLIGLALLLCALGGMLWRAYHTNIGMQWLSQRVLQYIFATEDMQIAGLEGSWQRGWQVQQITIHNPQRIPGAESVTLQQLQLPPPRQWIAAPFTTRVTAEPATLRLISGIGVRCATLRCSMRGCVVEDIIATAIPRLPPSSTVAIDVVKTAPVPNVHHVQEIRNGRVRIPTQAPILFYGSWMPQNVHIDVYAQTAELAQLLSVVMRQPPQHPFTASCTEVEGTVRGTWKSATLQLTYNVEESRYAMATLTGGHGAIVWSYVWHAGVWTHTGEATLHDGQIQAKRVTIAVHPSRIQFGSSHVIPTLDVHGKALVDTVPIDIQLSGTLKAPIWKLTSEPPQPQDKLFLILATGKRWHGVERALQDQQMSPNVAVELVDYLILGGRGTRLAAQLGIREITLIHEGQSTGVRVEKTLTNKIKAAVGMTRIPEERARPSTKETSLGVDYQLSEQSWVGMSGTRQTSIPSNTAEGAVTKEPSQHGVELRYDRQF